MPVCRKTAVTLAYKWNDTSGVSAPEWIHEAINDGTIKLGKHAQVTVAGVHGDAGSWILKRGKHWMVYGEKYFFSHFVEVKEGDLKA